MKIKFVVCIILLMTQLSFAQILVHLNYKKLNLDGHNVEMYYAVENLETLFLSLSSLKSFESEKAILESIGTPISEFSEIECVDTENFYLDLKTLFSKNGKFVINYTTKTHEIQFEVLRCLYDVCKFQVNVSLWGDYNCWFSIAAIISTKLNTENFTKGDYIVLYKILVELKHLSKN